MEMAIFYNKKAMDAEDNNIQPANERIDIPKDRIIH